MKHHLYPKSQKGFVILFTIIIATIILMMGVGIFSVATRETVLAGTAREAQYAFYAADAGIECALAGDVFFGNSFQSPSYSNAALFPCGDAPLNVSGGGGSSEYEFDIKVSDRPFDRSCAHVTVFVDSVSKRVISQGYNICTSNNLPDVNNPLLVERVLNTTYDYAPLTTVPITP